MDVVKTMNLELNESVPRLRELDGYYNGQQPAAYLSERSREALGGQFRALSVNFPRLVVSALAERLRVTGFKDAEGAAPDTRLWAEWRRNRMVDNSAQAHADALVYGRSYVIVWADDQGRPTISVESAQQMTTMQDPVTRQVTQAFKRWVDAEGIGHGVLYGPEQIKVMRCGRVVDGLADSTGRAVQTTDLFPAEGWTTEQVLCNPLGVVPVVPIVNRGRLLDTGGVSEMRDVLGLADALNKLMADAMVSSEFFARPRRWVTGLEIVEDERGNVIDPFSKEDGKLWQSESPETKFGQFDGARLDGYSDLTAVVTQQIGALTGLPPHYLGLHGDQPASADAIRSAEASLVARAFDLQRSFGRAWADVMSMVLAVLDRSDPLAADLETVWSSPETRTPAQSADAAAKLHGIGVPLKTLLSEVMDWAPEAVEGAMSNLAEQGQPGASAMPGAAGDEGEDWWK